MHTRVILSRNISTGDKLFHSYLDLRDQFNSNQSNDLDILFNEIPSQAANFLFFEKEIDLLEINAEAKDGKLVIYHGFSQKEFQVTEEIILEWMNKNVDIQKKC